MGIALTQEQVLCELSLKGCGDGDDDNTDDSDEE